MATQKVILLTMDGQNPVVYSNPESFYGPTSGAITAPTSGYETYGLFPLESLTCKQFDLYFVIDSVSGTFSPGQGLIVSLPDTSSYTLTPLLTSTGWIVIHYRDSGVTAEFLYFSNIPNQIVSLGGMYPYLPGGLVTYNYVLGLYVSGTSPAFGIDAYIVCTGE